VNDRAKRLLRINARIASAALRSGRAPADVRLVVVSKTFGPDEISEVYAAGIRVFGENRVQELLRKKDALPADIEWHLVGPLQKNKARFVAPFISLVHAIGNLEVAETLARKARECNRVVPILLEVNISGEPTKFGVRPEALVDAVRVTNDVEGIALRGLMAIPAPVDDPERARPAFRALRELRDGAQDALGLALPELSMGMSADFEIAIEEGATLVRVGTAIFGERT
jgi:hypothetical protein